MRIDLATIRRWADLIADGGDREADPGFLDTVDGECDALDIADYLIGAALDDEALAEATKAQEAALRQRRERLEHRAKAKRTAMLDLLDAIGVKKLERPRATISRSAGRMTVQIEDEDAIPTQLLTVKTISTPDKAAIKAQIEAGVDVPGAALVRGRDSIRMRTA